MKRGVAFTFKWLSNGFIGQEMYIPTMVIKTLSLLGILKA
jgi:hypothetical protein